MNRVLCVVIIVLLVACGVLSLGLNHYRDNAIPTKSSAIKKSVSWSWQMQPLLICSSASVMLLHLMPDTRGN
ncbi:hypothetical protein ECOSU61_12308 [Escherichia coli O157:H7 str. LSU-61]|nr:hypothetical protein ECOSU61_12308 [Escherichia coli O157:H7 str. LSU-61]